MFWLLIVSLVWAFSFGLIKGRLAGIDPALVAFVRLALALVVFLPFARVRGLRRADALLLAGIGAVQFGVMYVCYIAAFAHLAAYEVAALSIFTPLFVCMCGQALERRFSVSPWIAALLATVGAGVILMERPLSSGSWLGVLSMQVSNLCFAVGQVAYARWKRARTDSSDVSVFWILYLGAVVVTALPAAPAFATLDALGGEQWAVLLYLGVIASGLGFFGWNRGAAQTSTGALAVANNLKVPLAVACALVFFGESADLLRLAVGGALVVGAGLLVTRVDASTTRQRRA
jgi:drug/metabolite transporter (DMT)-like permease